MALIVVLVATAASALPAESHGWYAGLRSPSGMPCCNERDCHPVASRVNHDTGREEILANGAWYPVEYGKVLSFPSPDGGYHACWGNATGRPNFRCIPRSGQLESLPGFLFSPKRGLRRKCRSLPWLVTRLRNISAARTFRWHDLVSRSRQKAWV